MGEYGGNGGTCPCLMLVRPVSFTEPLDFQCRQLNAALVMSLTCHQSRGASRRSAAPPGAREGLPPPSVPAVVQSWVLSVSSTACSNRVLT